MQTISIPCRGGLNLSSNNHELLSLPGEAINLVNFECSKEGGYRRINGYEVLTTDVPESGLIKGVSNYQGILAARGDGLYHTVDDGVTWNQVNRDMLNVTEGDIANQTILPRTGTVRYMFARHDYNNKKYIYMTDGVNAPAVFSLNNGNYRFAELTTDSSPDNPLVGAKYCTFFKNQLVLAGMPEDPTAIYYSSLANTDLTSPEDDNKEVPQENFNGATSGSLGFGDKITGIKVHRETLYVFCETSIFKVQGIDSGQPISVPVTRDIGCLDGFSIQEIGGDLLFLAPDGLRTIAKTERLDDIELGVISRKIDDIFLPRVRQPERFLFNSTVIREKNQYRLWFTDINNPLGSQRGIIAAFTYLPEQRGFEWCFSETLGLGVTSVDNGYHEGRERLLMGNQSENQIMLLDSGDTFNGTPIDYVYQSPFTDMGDISLRKCIHQVLVNSKAEGNVEAQLEVRYDYNGSDVFQPFPYPLERMTLAAIFGSPQAIFGDPVVLFGARTFSDNDVYTEGSGFTVSFRIRTQGNIPDAPFDIQNFNVDLTTGGKV